MVKYRHKIPSSAMDKVEVSMKKDKYVAYVGTYTHGKSIGIYVYDVDIEKGRLKPKTVVPVNNSSHVAKSKNGKYLYSIADEGVEVFKILSDGNLEPINQVDIDGMRGCFLSTDYEGKYLYVAGYHDGKVTVIHTHADGRLGSVIDGVFHKGTGTVAERNFRPHVCCVRPTPDNKYLCAVDNGIDQIKVYKMNERKKKLEVVDIVRCERDSGPRWIRFSADGRFAYVVFQLSNKIGVYSYKDLGEETDFELLQEIDTLSDEEDPIHDAASAIRLSPDGKYLFSSTAGDDTVAMFSIDQETGLLTKEFALPISGEYPKDMVLFPDGKHIAVVNNESNSITTFKIDYENKILVQNAKPIDIDQPNCIIILKLEEGK